MFSREFCDCLMEEIDLLENSGLPLLRPNSMNKYGAVLSDIGLIQVWTDIYLRYLKPLFEQIWPELAQQVVGHHAFIVQYKMDEQKGLNIHFDQSVLTLNLCLGKEFSGGDLFFKGLRSDPESQEAENFVYSHVRGTSLLHRGEHIHGAEAISEGTRYNLIIWYQNSEQIGH
eukprot:TRINITY_DN1325_c0_g1_i3.p2 TRINITY_DN1325_c0_g1~~TRINITY_DN1325_c0_g1_i3.p2  ORF type:complete len:172 (+),score=40.48 TRINITY_DN1325_c0_g1_i3:564-1079(+)